MAQLAGIEPLQDQLERPRPDAGTAREGVLQGTHGEQNQPYHRSKGNNHQPVRPRARKAEQVREANRRDPPNTRMDQRTAGTPSSEATRRILLASARVPTCSSPLA